MMRRKGSPAGPGAMRAPIFSVAAVLVLVAACLALPAAAFPGVSVTSPADGSMSTKGSVLVSGTSSGSARSWSQTATADFKSGTVDGAAIFQGNVTLEASGVLDDFNDGSLDPAKWTKSEINGLTTNETGRMLVQSGISGGGIPHPETYITSLSNSTSVFADLCALTLTTTGGSLVLLELQQNTGTYVYIGLMPENGNPSRLHYIGGIMGSVINALDLGYAGDGLHTYGIVYSGGQASVYSDGNLLWTFTIWLPSPKIVIDVILRNVGDSVNASWDNVRTTQNCTYCNSGSFISAVRETWATDPVLKKVSWHGEAPSLTGLGVEVRSSDLENGSLPTPWAAVTNGQTLSLPAVKRYLQYRLTLTSTDGANTPVLNDITLDYYVPIKKVEVSIDGQASWRIANGTEQWQISLVLPENATRVWVRATDTGGDAATTSLTLNVDTAPPRGSIQINWGKKHTASRDVSLVLNATDHYGVASVLLSEKPDLSGASWQDYHPVMTYQLSNWDGLKTVYAKFKDFNGWESEVVNASITVDTSTPTGSVAIDDGAQFTNDVNVTLSFNTSDSAGIAEVLIGNTPDLAGALWAPYNATMPWTLLPGNGERSVYVVFRDPAMHESSARSGSIILDTDPPRITVVVGSGAPYANSTDLTLALNATDNFRVDWVEFSQDPLFANADRYPYRPVLSYGMPTGDGPRILYTRALDAAGNAGPANISSFTLDTVPPGSILGHLPAETEDCNITVSWGGSDDTSGIRWFDVQFRDGPGAWTGWLQRTVLSNSGFPGQEGHNYSFRVRALDRAGNQQDYPDGAGASVYVRPRYVPVVSITSPKDGARLGGTVNIAGKAFHPDPRRSVLRVLVKVDDGEWRPAAGTLNWTFRLDTARLPEGRHTLHVQAFDGERTSAEMDINITVEAEKGMDALPLFIAVVITILAAAGAGSAYAASRKRKGPM